MTEHENGTIRTVVWSEIFPWLCIVRALPLGDHGPLPGVWGGRNSFDDYGLDADWVRLRDEELRGNVLARR